MIITWQTPSMSNLGISEVELLQQVQEEQKLIADAKDEMFGLLAFEV